MKLKAQALAICASVLAVGGLSHAEIITWEFPIDGTQEVPPVATPGSGTGCVTFDTTTNDLTWVIRWSDTSEQPTGMHFHGPALPGQNGAVSVDIGAISGLTSPSCGTTVIDALQGFELENGFWYLNLHTPFFPGGEIRGHVVSPPPPPLACDGDANDDGVVDVNDISYVLFRLGNPCP
jgi:hypothetical protein